MTPEGKVKRDLKKYLRSLGPDIWWFEPVQTGYGRHGIPDFIINFHGVFVAIETKANGGKPTLLQDRNLREIQTAQGVSMVVNEHNLQDSIACLDILLKQIRATPSKIAHQYG